MLFSLLSGEDCTGFEEETWDIEFDGNPEEQEASESNIKRLAYSIFICVFHFLSR